MKTRKNTVKQRQAEIQKADDQADVRESLADHNARYIAWHKDNYTEEEHAKFLSDGIIPQPR